MITLDYVIIFYFHKAFFCIRFLPNLPHENKQITLWILISACYRSSSTASDSVAVDYRLIDGTQTDSSKTKVLFVVNFVSTKFPFEQNPLDKNVRR